MSQKSTLEILLDWISNNWLLALAIQAMIANFWVYGVMEALQSFKLSG